MKSIFYDSFIKNESTKGNEQKTFSHQRNFEKFAKWQKCHELSFAKI